VELGEEPAFQGYVQNIATASGFPDDFFRGNQVPSFDRRWPAIFATTYFNFGTGPGLAIREAYYTASLWQLLSKQICTRRINAAVFRLKQAYVVGCGAGLTPHEYSLVRHDNPKPNNKDLTRHKRDDGSVVSSKFLKCCEEEFLAFLREEDRAKALVALGDSIEDRNEFRASCVELLTMRDFVPEYDWQHPFDPMFEKEEHMCAVAVDMALPSNTLHRPSSYFLPWVNHASGVAIAKLRSITPDLVAIPADIVRTPCVYRLVSSFADFALDPELLGSVFQQQRSTLAELPCPTSERTTGFSQF